MELLASVLMALIIFYQYYKTVLPIKEELRKIKIAMNEERFWDKIEALSIRVGKIEVKLARMEGRMAVSFAVIGVVIQLAFKYFFK